MKVSKKKFKIFKDTCLLWIDKLGLTQYRAAFVHDTVENGAYAEININELGKVATFTLTNELSKYQMEFFNPESIARHEVFHLLTHRLRWLGDNRCITASDLDEEWEAVVRRLERIT